MTAACTSRVRRSYPPLDRSARSFRRSLPPSSPALRPPALAALAEGADCDVGTPAGGDASGAGRPSDGRKRPSDGRKRPPAGEPSARATATPAAESTFTQAETQSLALERTIRKQRAEQSSFGDAGSWGGEISPRVTIPVSLVCRRRCASRLSRGWGGEGVGDGNGIACCGSPLSSAAADLRYGII